jgi:hypothetical protein
MVRTEACLEPAASMSHPLTTPLPIAVRVYPDTRDTERDGRSRKSPPPRPDTMFVFDTETRTDTGSPQEQS